MKKYPKYKDSGIEWIGEMPEHWEINRLKHLVKSNLKYGANESAEFDNLNFPRYIRITDFGNDGVLKDDTFKSLPMEIAKDYLLDDGDLLFARSGATVGKTFLFEKYEGNACYAGYLIKASFDKNRLNSKFIKYYTQSNFYENWKESMFQKATIQNIGADKYNILPISFTNDLDEQNSIVYFLDKKIYEIQTLIFSKEKLIELLKEERTAIINHAVTKGINPKVKLKSSGVEWIGEVPEHWGIKRIRYLFDIIKNISGELGYDILSITQNGIKVKDITSGAGQLSMDYSKYQIVEVGDYAMNHMDLLTGFIDKSKVKGVTSPDYRVFRSISDESESEYFLYLFQMCYKNKIFFPLGQGSAQAGRWRLPTDEFRDFILPVPPQTEQNEIVKIIQSKTTEIDTIISKTEKEIELLNEYKTALISEVVTGKVDVREEVLV